MPAIPLIVAGVSAYTSYRQAKSASKVANTQKDLVGAQTGLAKELGGFARQQYGAAQPALSRAMQYYTNLATGNRGTINANIAPSVNAITESSRGAERGIEAKLAPGPSRDRQIAELYRGRAGQIGMLPFQARQAGVQGMAGLGQNYMSAALDAYGKSASALTGASTSGANWMKAQSGANDAWNSLINSGGKLATSAYDWYKNRGGGGGGIDLGKTPYGPGY